MNNSPTSSDPTPLNPLTREVQAECKTHGAYTAREIRLPFVDPDAKPIISSCPVCMAEAKAREEQRDRRRAEEANQQKIAGLLRRSMIPERFVDRTLHNYRADSTGQIRALKIARRYAETVCDGSSRGASLVLAGKPGTGKTHVACGIARELIEKHQKSAVFLTILQALRHIKDTYRKDSTRSESDAINDMLEPDLLILDEIGAQLGSEHEKMLMFEIINERYQECRSTILISNLTADELGQFLGDRVMDRFRESGAVVAFDWASHRGQRSAA
jgi:DNA replication protein DnaC